MEGLRDGMQGVSACNKLVACCDDTNMDARGINRFGSLLQRTVEQ